MDEDEKNEQRLKNGIIFKVFLTDDEMSKITAKDIFSALFCFIVFLIVVISIIAISIIVI